ncbi:glycosyltransferase family 2 protein [Anabaena sp. FACHB-1237]|uniref:glycosyltransferase n=1 Tax=Anabaena sp. FACHB-1237 TaxID=2692769 RepID=UPI001680105B|nr:glycosyltransferase family 2 protein [Anabaena sp. FACHB-1237]MBD2138888.1 glycosyltransferase family 2 protein [Anabaena sp. FACHB-1237]
MIDMMIFLSKSLFGWLIIQMCLTLIFLWHLRFNKSPLLPDDQLPKTAVILCLRGADPFLPSCLRSLLQQNYPDYDLKIIIDSPQDPAFKITKETINELQAKNAQITTLTEIRHNCSLKCTALLQAVSNLDSEYKIIAFVDADTIIHPTWLRELVSPLMDDKIGVTTGNRWYLVTNNYWGSLVRYAGNVSSVIQMFLFQIPWGGTLAIKTEVLHQIELTKDWQEVFNDDFIIHKLIKKHKLKIKFVPSLLILNRDEINLNNILEPITRLIINCKLYHPQWLAIISESFSSILVPNLTIITIIKLIIDGQFYPAFLLTSIYISYTIGLLIIILLAEFISQPVIYHQNQEKPKLSTINIIKLLLSIPLTQWVYGLVILSAIWTSTIKWRGLTYRIKGKKNIHLLEYQPYEWLDQPIDPKTSL